MRNFIEHGQVWEIPAPAGGALSGALIVQGTAFGIATHNAAEGDPLRVRLGGVVSLPANATQAFTLGAKLYWDGTAKALTTTAGSNTLVGFAFVAKETAGAVGIVRLNTDV